LDEFSRYNKQPPLVEVEMAAGEICPTYNKDVNENEPKKPQFVCNSPKFGDMYYKYKKPPSWTDRIFKNDAPWLICDAAERINHVDDHDAVLVSCEVASPQVDIGDFCTNAPATMASSCTAESLSKLQAATGRQGTMM